VTSSRARYPFVLVARSGSRASPKSKAPHRVGRNLRGEELLLLRRGTLLSQPGPRSVRHGAERRAAEFRATSLSTLVPDGRRRRQASRLLPRAGRWPPKRVARAASACGPSRQPASHRNHRHGCGGKRSAACRGAARDHESDAHTALSEGQLDALRVGREQGPPCSAAPVRQFPTTSVARPAARVGFALVASDDPPFGHAAFRGARPPFRSAAFGAEARRGSNSG